jgi:hypothetical protein
MIVLIRIPEMMMRVDDLHARLPKQIVVPPINKSHRVWAGEINDENASIRALDLR